jgi:hypothetical protein
VRTTQPGPDFFRVLNENGFFNQEDPYTCLFEVETMEDEDPARLSRMRKRDFEQSGGAS